MKGYKERNGKIYVRKTFRDEAGKRHEIWRKVDSKSEVRTLRREIENELERGTESFENRDSLNEYLDSWLKAIAGKVGEKTHSDYSSLMRLYVRPVIGKKRLREVRPLDVQAVISDLQVRGLSARTVRYCHTVLSSALKQAVRWRVITNNPAAYVELPKVRRQEMKSLSPKDAQRFLAQCKKDKHGLLFEFALITGMRPEEYLALQWTDLDLKKGTATIQRVLVRNRKGGGWSFKDPKTAKSRRTIPFPFYLAKQFEAHKRVQNEARLKLGAEWHNHNLVFCSEAGTPLSLRNLQRRHFKPILEKAKLENIRTYDLRHSCASLLLAAEENPKVVAERLGHASVVLTLDTYSHCLPTMQQAATDKLSKILKKG
jgi:integrase